MHWKIICVAAVLFVVADGQQNSRQQWESRSRGSWKETPLPDNNLIDIDLETDRNTVGQGWSNQRGAEAGGSGHGGQSADDDEDLVSSGSGSGANTPEYSEEDQPPKARAGPDVILYLPENRVTLCGNDSRDDRGIASYEWLKWSDLLSADIEMMGVHSVCLQLSNLQLGDYIFSLVVMDTGGNKDSDDVRVFVKSGTSPDPLTPCQSLRESSQHVGGTYVPRCNEDGNYDSLQCRGHPGTSMCWCADLDGREIPATAVYPPTIPDCDEGKGMKPCVFKLVEQSRTGSLGAFRPKCTVDGYFQSVQCSGAQCYCVRKHSGVRIPNTEVIYPATPICDGSIPRTTPEKGLRTKAPPNTLRPHTPSPNSELTTAVNVNIDQEGGGAKDAQTPEETKGNMGDSTDRQPSSAAHIMTQPGILAAIIGGSVVLLLCTILLVMFVVYRMRKKDEGSYALEEPKKMPHYSYQRAPDKEFYA